MRDQKLGVFKHHPLERDAYMYSSGWIRSQERDMSSFYYFDQEKRNEATHTISEQQCDVGHYYLLITNTRVRSTVDFYIFVTDGLCDMTVYTFGDHSYLLPWRGGVRNPAHQDKLQT